MEPAATEIPRPPRSRGHTGFTLIEIIISLAVAGILASIAGMGIVSAISSYAVVKENVNLAQKIQLAATRINRELMELTAIGARDHTRPVIVYSSATGQRQAIAKVHDTIRLYANPPEPISDTYLENNGDILTDSVDALTLNYFQSGNDIWDGTDLRELSSIQFSLNLFRKDTAGNTVTINTLVHLRNNDNYGGSAATLPPAPPSGAQYACFISTLMVNPVAIGSTSTAKCMRGALFWLLLGCVGLFFYTKRVIRAKTKILSSKKDGGSALIGMIVTIMVFAALGAAIVPMISSSQLQRTAASQSAQAYYLAESGLRYAASQYLNAADETAQYAALNNIHAVTHRLQDNQGEFSLSVNPYYFSVEVDPANTTTLKTRFYGRLADGYSIPVGGGSLSIEETLYAFSSASMVGQQITFNLLAPLTVPVDTPVYPVAQALAGQTVANGGALSLSTGSGDMFPDRNGSFVLRGDTYTYREKPLNANLLIGIKRTDGSVFSDIDLLANEDIRLKKFVKVTSTGVVGSGDMLASRDIVYHVQVPEKKEPRRITLHERFDHLDKWNASVLGLHEIADRGGNNVLRVTGVTQSGVDAPSASLIPLNTGAVQFNPKRFDAQVKIGFDETPSPPIHGYDSLPIPKYYSAGLCFRLYGDTNTYGLSFQRGNPSASPPGNIENDLIPAADMHAIVLWQATNHGADKQWMAYKQISDVFLLDEDGESGANGWTTVGDSSGNNLWHIDTHPPGYAAGSHAWYYGVNSTRTYNTGNRNIGMLISPPLHLCDYRDVRLRFSSWYETEPSPIRVNTADNKYVEVSGDNGATWDAPPAYQITADINAPDARMRSWQDLQVNLSAYAGQTIIIRFRFDTQDDLLNDWEGWYVDNIRILVDYPVDQSTLLARFNESAAVTFDTGGSDVIEPGDRIIGRLSDASATVHSSAVLQSGNWSASNAAGTLILDPVDGIFQLNERLFVPGKSELATLTGFRAQDHYIKAYFGTASGCGTPNTDSLDGEKHPNPLDPVQLNWPPDEGDAWGPAKDAFQLIQWDAINSAVATLDLINSVDEPDTLIRSSEAALMGNGSTLGLHTSGTGSLNVYFDDFGYQSLVDQPVAISQPLQY